LERNIGRSVRLNPRDVKRRMPVRLSPIFHSPEAAQEAEEHFIRQFTNRQLPGDIPDYTLNGPYLDC